jgi:hypothetical protein
MDTGIGITSKGETVRISVQDRRTHTYVIGKTGKGKSVLLENMMLDDLAAGRGFAFLDPHGTSAERIADCIPPERIDDIIYFDPTDPNAITFNPLECAAEDRHLIAEQVLTTIHDIWPDSWGPNLEYILLSSRPTAGILLARWPFPLNLADDWRTGNWKSARQPRTSARFPGLNCGSLSSLRHTPSLGRN